MRDKSVMKYDGQLTCEYYDNGQFSKITNNIKQFEVYKEFEICSENVLESKENLKGVLYQRTLDLERERVKQEILRQVLEGVEIENLEEKINTIDSKSIIIKRLLGMFPSYYGELLGLDFSG